MLILVVTFSDLPAASGRIQLRSASAIVLKADCFELGLAIGYDMF